MKNIFIICLSFLILGGQATLAKNVSKDPRYISETSPTSSGTDFLKPNDKRFKKSVPYKGVVTYKHNFNNGLFTIWEFKKGAFVPSHDHDSDQITYLEKGKVRIVQGSDKQEFVFNAGDTFILPAFIYHYLEALEDSRMVGVNPSTTENKSSNFRH